MRRPTSLKYHLAVLLGQCERVFRHQPERLHAIRRAVAEQMRRLA